METHYTNVTELPGRKASREQLVRLYGRYHFASQFCKGKYVLEAACGSGIGLGYLARRAKRVVGGDIDEDILSFTQKHYEGRKEGRISICIVLMLINCRLKILPLM